MAMVVKNNMSAVSTLNTLNKNQSALGKSLAKVSSGQKINSAQDDASGYAISERMRVMVRALDQANQNTQNGSSMMKVAEGAVANTIEILKTLKEKAINAATDTNTDDDRKTIQKEIDQFIDQINDNALATFNGKYLVDGSKSAAAVSTKTVLLNQSLNANLKDLSSSTALTALTDRSGKSLNIVNGDTIKVSWISQGNFKNTVDLKVVSSAANLDSDTSYGLIKGTGHSDTNSTSFAGVYSLSDIFIKAGLVDAIDSNIKVNELSATTNKYELGTNSAGVTEYIPDGQPGLVLTAKNAGIDSQISALTITVIDQYGNAKKSANERLEFKTAIFAANAQERDNALKIHVGAQAGQSISVSLADMRAEALGLQNASAEVINVSNVDKANAAIAAFDNALAKAMDQATTIGAIEARLEYTSSNLTTESENVQAAESTIRDADMAKEMTNYTKNNVLLQAAQSMLAQANQNSSAVLSLLQ